MNRDLRLNAVVLADHVERIGNGKVNLAGMGFDTFQVEAVPIAVNFAVMFQVELGPSEVGVPHLLHLEFIDPDGTPMAGTDTPFQVEMIPNDRQRTHHWTGSGTMPGFPIYQAGDYAIHILVDGVHLGRFPFYVRIAAQ